MLNLHITINKRQSKNLKTYQNMSISSKHVYPYVYKMIPTTTTLAKSATIKRSLLHKSSSPTSLKHREYKNVKFVVIKHITHRLHSTCNL